MTSEEIRAALIFSLLQKGGGGTVQSMFIHADSHTTKETYVVPVLTDEQILTAYNGVVAGNNVFIVDDLDSITIPVLDASNIDPDVSITALFRDKLVLTYQVGEDVVATHVGTVITKALNISDTPSDDKLPTEKAIYNYIASGNNGLPRALNQVNLNDVEATGFYACNVCTNRPTENNGTMIVIKNTVNVTTLVQIYFSFVADEMWVRHKDNGIWKDWVKVLKVGDNIPYDNTVSGLLATTIKAAIDELAEMSVPPATSADNGKFMRVVDGEAAWATVPVMEGGSY